MSLSEAECGAFPPRAAYHAPLAPLSVVRLSRRDKSLTASSLEAKLTLRILRASNTPRARLSELRWQKCPISTGTTVRTAGLSLPDYISTGTLVVTFWVVQHKCASPFYFLCLHDYWESTQDKRQEEDGRRQERRLLQSRAGNVSGRYKKCIIRPSPRGTERAP